MAISDQLKEGILSLAEENLNNTTTLPNYQSILLTDPEAVPSNVDVSQLRTQTDTNPELLAAISEFPGLKFDTTSYDQYSDLYDLYSGGLPMVDTGTTATIPAVTTPVVETGGGGGGGESQVTGGLTTDLTTDQGFTQSGTFGGNPTYSSDGSTVDSNHWRYNKRRRNLWWKHCR